MIMLTKRIVAVGLVASALLTTGCATVVHGPSQSIRVKSKPNHAQLVVDGDAIGSTPTTLNLSRNQDHTVKVSLPGYATTEFALTRRMSGWFFGNLFLGGIIGIAVDASTGAMYTLTPQELPAYANTTQIHYREKKQELVILLVNNADPSLRKIGQLKKA